MAQPGQEAHQEAHQRRLAARAGGAMMIAGAVLALVTVALPPRASGSDVLVLALGAISGAMGIGLLAARRQAPEWVLGLVAATGTILITVASDQGGIGTGTADNEMLYLWVCLLAFNFLALRNALIQLAVVGLAYGWLLREVPLDEAATRWLVCISSLLVAGLFIYRLRSSRETLVAELSARARNDGLTGLLNRAALEERAAVELARAHREGTPLSLIALDIDGFKSLNDSQGHPAGDQVLRSVAGHLMRETRQIDAIARLGGDEFAVLLPGASQNAAEAVARRLARVARTNARGATVSIGVATGPPADGRFETLWAAADAAMYSAKRAGGNAVASAAQDRPDAPVQAASEPGVA